MLIEVFSAGVLPLLYFVLTHARTLLNSTSSSSGCAATGDLFISESSLDLKLFIDDAWTTLIESAFHTLQTLFV